MGIYMAMGSISIVTNSVVSAVCVCVSNVSNQCCYKNGECPSEDKDDNKEIVRQDYKLMHLYFHH